jgi:hypothetical protein
MKSGAENRMARLRILAFWPDWKTGIHQAQKGVIPEDRYTPGPEGCHTRRQVYIMPRRVSLLKLSVPLR